MESVVLLIRAGRIAVELLEKEIVPLAISVPQLSIVISLYEWGEMTASRLCEITMRDKANISSLLKKLETADKGNIAVVRTQLQSDVMKFFTFFSFIHVGDGWKMINDLPYAEKLN